MAYLIDGYGRIFTGAAVEPAHRNCMVLFSKGTNGSLDAVREMIACPMKYRYVNIRENQARPMTESERAQVDRYRNMDPRCGPEVREILETEPDMDQQLLRAQMDLDKETDRGAAMVGVALLDAALKGAIISRLYPPSTRVESMLFSLRGPAGTSENLRILAYASGLIGPITEKDLKSICWIRNRFGHQLRLEPKRTRLTFEHALIAEKCRKLQLIDVVPCLWLQPNDAKGARNRFERTVMQAYVLIRMEMMQGEFRLHPSGCLW